MPEDPSQGCVDAAAGPILPEEETVPETASSKQGVLPIPVMVGHEAPNFEATAYQDGAFKNIRLSDYRGKWLLLCFYPGDFTFV